MVVIAVAMFTISCGGNKSTETESSENVEATADSSASLSNLDLYIQLIEKATPLLEKVSKGDAAAVQEYATITEEMTKVAMDLQSELADNPDMMAKYTEAAQKFAEEVVKASGL